MNAPDPVEQWFELSFLTQGSLERVALRSVSPNAIHELGRAVDQAIRRFLDAAPGESHAISLISLASDMKSGSAGDLLNVIAEAISLEFDDESEPEEEQAWDNLVALAERVDSVSSPDLALVPVSVDFVWDNGGGDDNAFSDGFLCCQADPENLEAAYQFVEALKEWGENESHWYDFSYIVAPTLDPHEDRMNLEDFAAWMSESEGVMAQCLAPVIEAAESHELQVKMESSLAAPVVSRTGPRL